MQSCLQGPGGQIWGDINGSGFKDMERCTHMTNRQTIRCSSCIKFGIYCTSTPGSAPPEGNPSRCLQGNGTKAEPRLHRTAGSAGNHPPVPSSHEITWRKVKAFSPWDQYADDTRSPSPLLSLILTPQFHNLLSIRGAPSGTGIKVSQKRINPDKTEVMMRVRSKYLRNVASVRLSLVGT